MKILDFGCGTDRYPGAIAIDLSKQYLTGADDILWDLNKYPYPIENECADIIYCSHVIEHLKCPEKTLIEFARIIKPSGKIIIKVPHASCLHVVSTPVHKHNFSSCTIYPYIEVASEMITIDGQTDTTKKPILQVTKTILRPHYWNKTRTKRMWWLDVIKMPYRLLLCPLYAFINQFPNCYERHFYGVFPIAEIEWTMKKTEEKT